MNYPNYEQMSLGSRFDSGTRDLAALSTWIDQHNRMRHPDAALALRTTKIGEEIGEVAEEGGDTTTLSALYGRLISSLHLYLGENPRKTEQVDQARLLKELLDVATAALGDYEHITGNQGEALPALLGHIESVHTRAGLA
jgi:hypothetical protein